jgi:hypothetical protein
MRCVWSSTTLHLESHGAPLELVVITLGIRFAQAELIGPTIMATGADCKKKQLLFLDTFFHLAPGSVALLVKLLPISLQVCYHETGILSGSHSLGGSFIWVFGFKRSKGSRNYRG